MITSYVQMPNHRQMYDTDHVEIDEAISEATDRLNAFLRVWSEFDRINEEYLRLRFQIESGCLPHYGNPLGGMIDSSGGGSNGAENAIVNMVMLENQVEEARQRMMIEQQAVRDLIHKVCITDGRRNYRLETALVCRYCTTPPVPYGQMPKEYPQYFLSKHSAQWAVIQGEMLVAEYVLGQRRAAAACVPWFNWGC